ncbi:alpha/beta fold hydrolase [Pseudonocardia endophytica]|uniref:Pimeloyl-ACP methyl ester carboxylesterase n=1 Tax=Pseudonocardia endophytica TaxID=401976 RepID=A0A4V2PJ58_PSEEN|nr:alpha/beta fold hydrolase [Pseudonocardia endophytica]TCK27266.1 pimeloyl-ACP methyl ester carboxylesterase [Pseudonocardia endophytica]
MRARYPDVEATLERDGVTIRYEVHGTGGPALLLPSSMPLVQARQWKAQVPFLARCFRVIVVDSRGNGGSGRPRGPESYTMDQLVADLVAVLDATGTARAVAVGLSAGGRQVLELAAAHPDRVAGVVAIAPTMIFDVPGYDDVRDSYEGEQKINRHYIAKEYADFAAFFLGACYSDPHSIKPWEDAVSWAAGTTPEVLIDFFDGLGRPTIDEARETCSRVRCPVLVLHGDDDLMVPVSLGEQVAEWTGGTFVRLRGAGHVPTGRDPVRTNLLIRDFADTVTGRVRAPRSWTPARNRPRRALFLSSPIGLGHARRDLAIADELRALRPDVEIEWLAQHPVTEVLAARGERIHPASRWLASESGHVESECGEHDLNVFEAVRSMDEILVANFHVLDEIARTEHHDLLVGDEAWDLDHHLHENPELKRSAYAWLTDFVGVLPMPDAPDREAGLTADQNAQMIEQVERYPRLRDAALFVGDLDDVVPDAFGPGLPSIRDWTADHYAFPGYVTGFTPIADADRAGIREELGWADGEPVCLLTAGGTGVGLPLLRRVLEAVPLAARRVDGLRTVVVTGPRIDPATLPPTPGVEVHGWVPDLYRRLAACDLGITHGGLTTTMELTANRRPFLYVPLRRHFEQNLHVPHRLARHRAGRRMDWDGLDPDVLADAIASEIGREVDHAPVDPGGAARVAVRLAELL